MDSHAARVALLAEDLFDASPRLLAAAIDRHVSRSPYLPKASDLRELMAEMTETRRAGEKVNLAERYNNRLLAEGNHKLRWRYSDPSDLNSELLLESTERGASKIIDA